MAALDPAVPIEESVGAMAELQAEGKVHMIGASNVGLQELRRARAVGEIAWLLQRSSVMLPIPGTSSVTHLEENTAAAGLRLTADEIRRLSG